MLAIGSWIAAVLGDNVGYAFGRRVGPRIFTKEDSIFFKKEYIRQALAFYEKHGVKTIILARFVPIVRTFAPIVAGVGQMQYRTFFLYNVVGGGLWTLGMSLAGYFLGKIIPGVDQYLLPIVLIIIIVSVLPGVWEVLKARRSAKVS
ncbi:MAG: VTT domain-containing protein [bacterium]